MDKIHPETKHLRKNITKEYRNIRRISESFKRIYKKTASLWEKKQKNIWHSNKKSIADIGYESEENYVLLDQKQQIAFIKPSNYKISKTRKYINDIGHIENMNYTEENASYIVSAKY